MRAGVHRQPRKQTLLSRLSNGCWWTEAGVVVDRSRRWQPEAGAGGQKRVLADVIRRCESNQKMRAEARLIWKPLPDSSLVQVIPCSCETEHQIPL